MKHVLTLDTTDSQNLGLVSIQLLFHKYEYKTQVVQRLKYLIQMVFQLDQVAAEDWCYGW